MAAFSFWSTIGKWPILRQIVERDPTGRGVSARSDRTREISARTVAADKVVPSLCPYCAVGCAQRVFVRNNKVIQIEGDPDSPVSGGRLCPKGAASGQLVSSPLRMDQVLYRPPYGTQWQELDLETALDMVAGRVIEARRKGWEDNDADGRSLRRCLSIASLGGATLDNEENYLMKKLYTALGALQIENQARI